MKKETVFEKKTKKKTKQREQNESHTYVKIAAVIKIK